MPNRMPTNCASRTTTNRKAISMTPNADVRQHCSEPCADPLGRVVEQVLDRIRVLPGRLLAAGARCEGMHGALNNHEVLVGAGGDIEVTLAVSNVIMAAHC